MRFYLKRLYYGIQQRKAWLLLVFLLPILFILLSALIPDRFAITQKIAIQPDAPVALAQDRCRARHGAPGRDLPRQ